MSNSTLRSSGLLLLLVLAGRIHAAERPTFNHTADPRPDILAHPFYYAHTEYRRAYNRPRDFPGWLAYKIEPSSQEAMVWCENVRAGNYDSKHMPPMCKTYYYPKPWEALLTGPRPDFASNRSVGGDQALGGAAETPAMDRSGEQEQSDSEQVEGQPADEKAKSNDKPRSQVPLVPLPSTAVRSLPSLYNARR